MSAFDAFDLFEPDMFLGQAYNLTSDLIKCIYERPHLKVGLRAGDWETLNKTKGSMFFMPLNKKYNY